MKKFAEIHLKPEVLARYGLPDIAYPLSESDFKAALADNGELPLEDMLLALQERSSETKAYWQALAPQSELELVSVAGDDWWLELGPVDLRGRFVSLQRGDVLLAAIAPREDGRLRVAVLQMISTRV